MVKKIILILAFTLSGIGTLFSQSTYLMAGENGSGLEASFLISGQDLIRFGGSMGFSLGGRMDIGMYIDRGSDDTVPEGADSLDFGIIYNYILLGQTVGLPISAQILGAYGISNVRSDQLDAANAERTGLGWTAGIRLFRDFYFVPEFTFRLGGEFSYSAARYETAAASGDPADLPPGYDPVERIQRYHYGIVSGLALRLIGWPVIALGFDVLFDQDGEINFRPTIGAVLPSRT